MTVSAVVFAFLCFGRHGSRTDTVSLSSEPALRLTWLDYHPVAHGFRLEGHVWNESNQTLRNVQTTVLALDASGKAVGQVQGAVTPDNLEPGKRGRFLIMCEQSWAETNHELRFTSGQNLRLKYVEQYPPTRISFSNTRED